MVDSNKPLKTRFAPSPTGYLHVGGARTALYNFLMARRNGGTFQLRIEDTDRARHDESAIEKIAQDLRWLGIEWDEGIEVGGPNGPYRQSERLDIYEKCISQLIEQGKAYYAFDTQEELDALRGAAEAAKQTFRFTRPASFPSKADAEGAAAAGKPVVVRLMVPGHDVTIHDDAFGDVTMPASEQDDFIIRKADGWPTYHLANVVDDATMGVTYIMRGQEFLGQTWRHVLLREALGFPEPGYCHLPLIMDMQGRKLSKRDGDVEVHAFRVAGYLPEVLINFIALLGWRPAIESEKLTLGQMKELFSPDRIGKSNAKFDRDKLLAFNTDAVAAATPERLLAGFKDYLSLNETPIPKGDDALLAHILACCHGFRTFADLPAKAGVLFIADDAFAYEEKAVDKVLKKGDAAGLAVLRDMAPLLEKVDWSAEALQKLLDDYCRDKNAGMGKVAQPIRVAVTGSTISPPIIDTLTILGREKTLARIARCLKAN
jgi:glutamyl-tRNA synthetase